MRISSLAIICLFLFSGQSLAQFAIDGKDFVSVQPKYVPIPALENYHWKIEIISSNKEFSPDGDPVNPLPEICTQPDFHVWENDQIVIRLVKNFDQEPLDIEIKGYAAMLWECSLCAPPLVKKLYFKEGAISFSLQKDLSLSAQPRKVIFSFERMELWQGERLLVKQDNMREMIQGLPRFRGK
ncbi:MAG: hypothetical protein AAFY71_16815 [Bacteroidota bacterium]